MIEQHFNQLDGLVEELSNTTNNNYLDSLITVLDMLLSDQEQLNRHEFVTKVKQLHIDRLEKDQVRKVIEFAILKGLRGAVQNQHLITPDTIASYIAYLIEKIFPGDEEIRLFDIVSGSGNLITAVMNQLKRPVKSYGSEVDPSLIELSVLSANLQQNAVEFFHQDSLQPFLLDPVDLVIADLPVGYYPDDERAKSFKVHVTNEHTYAHHLLIEQSLNYTKEAGFLIFVIPNSLFNSDQATKLHELIRESAHVVGLLQLPSSIFKSEQNEKSLFILQKKSEQTKAPKEALLAKLPSFKDLQATENIVAKMNQWFEQAGYNK
ncbi:class I SAM-dependent methyltransferase [Amphibacillus indicireducens]|uniref:Class I SAM-dependent methyltransferase n=1 Tax=Amphibacillus indicireducens TaxID=1076330 RepID=A0ABP7VR64_9BACI